MRVSTAASALLTLGISIAGCSGGGGSNPGEGQHGLVATPPQLSAQSSYPAQILVTGIHGLPKVTLADPTFADIGTPLVNGSSASFTVSPVAGGNTSITVTDGSGDSVIIPVSIALCEPPVPALALLAENVALPMPSPSPGSGTLPIRLSTIFVTTLANTQPFVTDFSLRLIGSDGSIYEGPPLAPASQAPAATGATPAPAPSGDTEYFDPAPVLQAHTAYRVQLLGEHCLPPDVFGSFST
jgi:hypothetical protein